MLFILLLEEFGAKTLLHVGMICRHTLKTIAYLKSPGTKINSFCLHKTRFCVSMYTDSNHLNEKTILLDQ